MEINNNNTQAHDLIGNIAGVAALAIGGMLVARVIKKQTLAAEIRKNNPAQTYHQRIVSAYKWLGYENPFKI